MTGVEERYPFCVALPAQRPNTSQSGSFQLGFCHLHLSSTAFCPISSLLSAVNVNQSLTLKEEMVLQVVKLMVPMLKFYFHDGVRSAAAECLPFLLECAKIRGTQYVSEMWQYICPELLKAVETEPENEASFIVFFGILSVFCTVYIFIYLIVKKGFI